MIQRIFQRPQNSNGADEKYATSSNHNDEVEGVFSSLYRSVSELEPSSRELKRENDAAIFNSSFNFFFMKYISAGFYFSGYFKQHRHLPRQLKDC